SVPAGERCAPAVLCRLPTRLRAIGPDDDPFAGTHEPDAGTRRHLGADSKRPNRGKKEGSPALGLPSETAVVAELLGAGTHPTDGLADEQQGAADEQREAGEAELGRGMRTGAGEAA